MEAEKISNGATKILVFLSASDIGLDPAEKIAALRSAADIIQQTLQAEAFKASMASLMRTLMGPSGPVN
jgi:hypothetical protein